MNFEHVTVVLQGPLGLGTATSPDIATVVASIRAHLPGAPIRLATWDRPDRPTIDVDEVLWLEDPGPLPPLKTHPPAPNNANRQIRSTAAGLARVTTPYALKMRTDCLLTGHAFARWADEFPARDPAARLFEERLVVSSLYSINPRVTELVPFHLSDWFQFGRTRDLARLWDAPFVTPEEATHFARHPHRPDSRPLEKRFLARYAVEQHVFRHAVSRRFDVRCAFVDDVFAEDLDLQDRILANNVVLGEPERLGFVFPKNAWASRSKFHRFNCYTHLDWLDLYVRHAGGEARHRAARLRRRAALAAVATLAPALQFLLSKR